MEEQPQNEAPAPAGSTPGSPGVTDATVAGGRSDPVVLDAVGHGTPEATAGVVEDAEAGAVVELGDGVQGAIGTRMVSDGLGDRVI